MPIMQIININLENVFPIMYVNTIKNVLKNE